MNSESAVAALGALAQNTRLATLDLLARAEPEGMPAGEIARQLGVPKNTMSSHLAILAPGGIISAKRCGRLIVYRANIPALGSLIHFLGSIFPGEPSSRAPADRAEP